MGSYNFLQNNLNFSSLIFNNKTILIQPVTEALEASVGRVYINETQYFPYVPEEDWNFYIGGYQPAQKWLKDRKVRELSYDDILHYQKIIVALTETDRIVKEIDEVDF